MKFSIDNQLALELNETKQKVIKHNIPDELFLQDMARRVHWIIMTKYGESLKDLKEEWLPKLKEAGHAMIPTDDDALAELIFQHPEYKSRSQRDSR